MTERVLHNTEIEVLEALTKLLSKIGFHIQFTDTNYRLRTPDFIAKKRVDGAEYKIAIELKSSSNVNEAIRNGVKILTEMAEAKEYDKLLLLLLNRDKRQYKNSAFLQQFLSSNPTNLEILNLEDLEKWSQDLSNELSFKGLSEVYIYIKQLSRKLIELVAKRPDSLKEMEWRDLERVVSELFEGLGFKTTLTPSSKDGGKDVILECTIDDIQKSFVIEIKHWRSGQRVGQKTVKEFTKIIINEKRDKGLFLSTYGFSNNFYESLSETEKTIVRFGEQEKIVELCRTYEKISNGIWNPTSTLEDILFENTIKL
ncbi:restriction endonuclease [Bacteroides fragilis]|uniref:restriction endonuclease n=1 Tax=Bacteroides fragilis TaxID=817 RepID=UPI00202E6BD0|nr:restriction endonuclease [Bacteroides fragilis]MCM0314721.1 restriction endonuclease [Bacteroides fragilis]